MCDRVLAGVVAVALVAATACTVERASTTDGTPASTVGPATTSTT